MHLLHYDFYYYHINKYYIIIDFNVRWAISDFFRLNLSLKQKLAFKI